MSSSTTQWPAARHGSHPLQGEIRLPASETYSVSTPSISSAPRSADWTSAAIAPCSRGLADTPRTRAVAPSAEVGTNYLWVLADLVGKALRYLRALVEHDDALA